MRLIWQLNKKKIKKDFYNGIQKRIYNKSMNFSIDFFVSQKIVSQMQDGILSQLCS